MKASEALALVARWISGEEELPAAEKQLARAASAAAAALRTAKESPLPEIDALCAAAKDAFASRESELTPSRENPIGPERRLDRLLLFVLSEAWRLAPPEEQAVCPAVADFPGSVPDDATDEPATVSVDATYGRWIGTQRYARPGGIVEIRAAPEAIERGLRIRIGAHADELYSEKEVARGCHQDYEEGAEEQAWTRWPDLSFDYPLEGELTTIASPFGGLVYVVVPEDGEGSFEVEISGAVVPAPTFILGETSLAEWRDSIRHRPAPWGELACSRIIFTVPSAKLRALEDPESLMQLWEDALVTYEELGGEPFNFPERLVADRQISLGYLHSGYPLMGTYDADDESLFAVLDEKAIRADGNAVWGAYHEIGHNRQRDAWTFEGTDEVTNNVFVLHAVERINGVAAWDNPRIKETLPEVKRYLAAPDFAKWKDDPFLALAMYARLVAEFGWQPFYDAFAGFAAMPEEERPQDDDAKRDAWLVAISKAVGRNLSGYFDAWGVPTRDEAKAQLADLEAWDGPIVE
ncbi:peptidase M60-like family-domain-containing protein [Hyaloraphidium curvatum]|nr:peptidase M60-like family-domain-containing protein [Hyaloraphidium curvatum]